MVKNFTFSDEKIQFKAFKASPIIKAAPFPSLVGEGQRGVRGEVYKRGFIFG